MTIFSFSVTGERSYKFKHLSTEKGLPSPSVRCVFQDSHGVMWISIESLGLCRYDGNSFDVFGYSETDSNTISNNFVNAITEDKEGNLWIGTQNGLNVFNPNTLKVKRFKHIEEDSASIGANFFTSVISDRSGNIWLGTQYGISVYNSDTKRFYNLFSNKSQEETTSERKIFESSQGDIYTYTGQKGIYVFSRESIVQFSDDCSKGVNNATLQASHNITITSNSDSNPQGKVVTCFAEDIDHSIYIGTYYGAFKYRPDKKQLSKLIFEDEEFTSLNNTGYSDILIDSQRNLWGGTTSNGVFVYNLSTKEISNFSTYYNKLSPIKSNSIRNIYVDNSGLIWIATKFEGIYIYDNRQEEFIHRIAGSNITRGLNDPFVLSFCETSDGIIWIGTKTGGLNRWNPVKNRFTYIEPKTPPHSDNKTISHKRVQCIEKGDNDNLWLGNVLGIEKFDTKTNNSSLVLSPSVNSIAKGFNKLWVGTDQGLFCFNIQDESFYHQPSKHKTLFNNNKTKITQVIASKDSTIWIATNTTGLYKYFPTTDSLVNYRNNKNDSYSISGDMVRGMLIDSENQLWVGTKSAGLNKYDAKNDCFIRVKCSIDLTSRTIYNMIEDENRNLWMGTHNGIVKYDINKNTAIEFNAEYGLQSNIFEINAAYKLLNGDILIGGQNGFNRFNPDLVSKHKYIAPVIISKFKVLDQIIDQNINSFRQYKLKQKSNFISFEFALLDYSKPNENQYAYKLTPFDEEWKYCDNRSYTSYTNLPSGVYTFSVKGANMDGYWNEKGISIEFEIPTPLWEKGWFQLLGLIVIVLLISTIILTRIKIAKRREQKLKQLVKERTSELSYANKELTKHRENLEELVTKRTFDLEKSKEKAEESDRLKSAFLANMSHEIRTPLNAILGFSSIISATTPGNEELSEMNEIIQSNGTALLQLINDIIDISMIEANQLEIVKNYFELNNFLIGLQKQYQQQLLLHKKEKNIKIELDLPKDYLKSGLSVFLDSQRLNQIFTNLFGNALKFTDSGYIKFGYTVTTDKNTLMFYVEDTGIGIKQKYLKEIFERFRKIESKRTGDLYRGTGLGLSICKNLVNLMNGKISVKSELRKGTRFNFSIPINTNTQNTKHKKKKPQTEHTQKIKWENKTLMIVEDEESNYQVLKAMLLFTNAKIIWAKNGKEAVDFIEKNQTNIDIILMDIKMPLMDGNKATKIIKKKYPTLPIIAQTAYATPPEIRSYMNNGFDDYITKPVLSTLLIEKINKLIN